jgi:phosphotransferase system  glucose/maltose/N-acetylglucosamine-specific IIC component
MSDLKRSAKPKPMEHDNEKYLLEIRSLKLGIVLAGSLIALAIAASAPSPDIPKFVVFVLGVAILAAVTGLIQIHFKRKNSESRRRLKSENQNEE